MQNMLINKIYAALFNFELSEKTQTQGCIKKSLTFFTAQIIKHMFFHSNHLEGFFFLFLTLFSRILGGGVVLYSISLEYGWSGQLNF